MSRRDKEDIDDEDLIDNMADILEDIVVNINTKDKGAIVAINANLQALQGRLADSCKETFESEEWNQDDLVDLAAAALLLATAMGIPSDDNKINDEKAPGTPETSTAT